MCAACVSRLAGEGVREMGSIRPVLPVKMICGVISADEALFAGVRTELEKVFGVVDLESETYPFSFTDYYREEMGDGLSRKFYAFRDLADPSCLADMKLRTNGLESVFSGGVAGKRPVNIDPGYVTDYGLVLATTKNFAHRIYLSKGIYGEVTLNFRKGGCVFFEWTYPDYKSGLYTPFLLQARSRYMAQR